ncbi:MAG: hypothetical protein ACRDUB_07005, partial [Mycobacterium sp.]
MIDAWWSGSTEQPVASNIVATATAARRTDMSIGSVLSHTQLSDREHRPNLGAHKPDEGFDVRSGGRLQ